MIDKLRGLFLIVLTAVLTVSAASAQESGRVQFKKRQFIKTYYQDGTTGIEPEYDGGPYLHIELTYNEPVRYAGKEVPNHLRSFCRSFFFGDFAAASPGTIESEFENEAAAALSDWKENGLPIVEDYPEAASSAMWEMERSMSVEYNQKGILALGNHFYRYTGGAHGIYSSEYSVYDVETAKVVTLDMLFTGDWYGAVTYMISEEAKRQYEIDPFASLTAAGFFVDDLEPTSNFYFSGEDIVFFYNVYEVAPYVMGGIEISIPLEDFGVLLNKNGAAGKIIHN